MSLVAKVKDTAGSLYGQAKAKYAESDALQKAGQQAGQAAGQAAGKLRGLSGKAGSGQLGDRLRAARDKATTTVKDARARKPGQK